MKARLVPLRSVAVFRRWRRLSSSPCFGAPTSVCAHRSAQSPARRVKLPDEPRCSFLSAHCWHTMRWASFLARLTRGRLQPVELCVRSPRFKWGETRGVAAAVLEAECGEPGDPMSRRTVKLKTETLTVFSGHRSTLTEILLWMPKQRALQHREHVPLSSKQQMCAIIFFFFFKKWLIRWT